MLIEIREELKEYVEREILPRYKQNDKAHDLKHIQSVIDRSFLFASQVEGINLEMVYVIAVYHDLGCSIDRDNHEKISADILLNDRVLKRFFSQVEIEEMAQAVTDHRASSVEEPKSIYGKIVSSADRNTDLLIPLQRTYYYRISKEKSVDMERVIEDSRKHLIDKYGSNGYAKEKMYFEDKEYELFLNNMQELVSDKDKFRRCFMRVNGLS